MRYKRVDGERLSGLDGFHSVLPYVMPRRTDAEVSCHETFDVTDLCDYMARRNSNEGIKLKLFHAFCTAFARTIFLRPKLNIFIAGKRFWQRSDITMSFVVKREFKDSAEESLMFMKVDPDMNIDSISKLILGDVDKLRKSDANDLDKAMNFVGKLPRFLVTIIFGIIRLLEYFGIMPKALMAGDPNYSTVLLSNLGSIGIGSPYHHLNNYGTCSIMITIGTMKKQFVNMPDGSNQERVMLDATFTLDERIADGFYFAKALRIMHYLLENPEALAEKISDPVPVAV